MKKSDKQKNIDRRNFLKYVGAGAAAWQIGNFLPALTYAKKGSNNVSKPNILLITSEDNGPQLSCYGDPFVKTLNLDKLAGQGVRFSNAFVTQAGCSPSRASIFTGCYTHQNGQIGLATHNLRMYRPDMPNIFSVLKSSGYRTGIIGKIHVNPESALPLDYHDNCGGFGHRDVRKEAQLSDAFINKDKTPFLLMVNYKDAHRDFYKQKSGLPEKPFEADDVKPLPYIGLDSQNIREQTANYYNCMSRLDTGIGLLMDVLDRSGQSENTLVIYLGDHGASFFRDKTTCYEGGTKIPMIMRWPKTIKAGLVREELVSTIDLMPTILAAAGLASDKTLPGMSLNPLFKNGQSSWRKYLFTEYHLHSGHDFYPQRAIRDERYKLIWNLMPGTENPGFSYIKRAWYPPNEINLALKKADEKIRRVYETLRVPPEYELYDLQNDPYEFNNLADSKEYKTVSKRLRSELADWRKKTNDPLLKPENLKRLKAELDSCWIDGKYTKREKWDYPDYFFK